VTMQQRTHMADHRPCPSVSPPALPACPSCRRRILDCQFIMRAMGYVRVSVAHMSQLTLHPSFKKKRDVQLSNWETPALRWEQAKYAALDVLTVNHGEQ
jgi:hypothetical protein